MFSCSLCADARTQRTHARARTDARHTQPDKEDDTSCWEHTNRTSRGSGDHGSDCVLGPCAAGHNTDAGLLMTPRYDTRHVSLALEHTRDMQCAARQHRREGVGANGAGWPGAARDEHRHTSRRPPPPPMRGGKKMNRGGVFLRDGVCLPEKGQVGRVHDTPPIGPPAEVGKQHLPKGGLTGDVHPKGSIHHLRGWWAPQNAPPRPKRL